MVTVDEIGKNLHGEELLFVAGRPGTGKSTLGFLLMNYWKMNHSQNILFFSLDASKELVRKKMESLGIFSFSNLIIEDKPRMSISEMIDKCHKIAKSEKGLGLVLVDYLQLVDVDAMKLTTNFEKKCELIREWKALSLRLHVPVVLISQLSRFEENLSDLEGMFDEKTMEKIDKIFFLHTPEEIMMVKNCEAVI